MQCKGNIKKFCDDSTIHGFKELYYARNCGWKSFWTLVILGATAITCYQVYDSVMFYWEQPTVINVYPLEGDIEIPNIDFCFHNKYVLGWITLDTEILNNETDQYFLHFLSKLVKLAYLDVHYSNSTYFEYTGYMTYFPETKALNNLYTNGYNDMLVKNNVTNEVFYGKRFIAKSPNIVIRKDEKTYLEPIKRTFAGNYICYAYTLNDTNHFEIGFPPEMMQMLMPLPSIKHGLLTWNILSASYRDVFKSNYYQTASTLNVLHDGFDNDPQNLIVGIGNIQPFIFKKHVSYDIRMGVNKLKYLNSATKPCTDENGIQPSFLFKEVPPNNYLNSNYSCYNFCLYRKRNASTCILIDQAFGLQNNEELEVKICEPPDSPSGGCGNNDCSPAPVVDGLENIDEECSTKCPKQCTQWIYFAAIIENNPINPTNTFSTIDVTFPSSSSVLVSEEQNAYTWTSLIGNVGGLLGLWLGASLLSFLQMFYLLLFPPKNMVDEISKQSAVGSVAIQKSNIPRFQSNKTTSFQIT